jgi:microcompartment protein CcmL/EutN
MSQRAHIAESESAGIIECSGSIALAKLLQTLKIETRARIVGVTAANAAGITTLVIAGGLAEVQHATEHVKTLSGVADAAFFVRPDKEAMSLLLKSLMIAETEAETIKEPRVRPVEDLHISEIETWNVHELRRYARSLEALPIKGRNISKATRSELLHLLQTGGYIYLGSTSPRAYPPANELQIVN